VLVRAPCRVDLAGGTLDIYPLYLFEGEGLTLNAAVDLWSEAEVVPEPRGVRIISLDTGVALRAPAIEELEPAGEAELLVRAVRVLGRGGLRVRTRNRAPRGSGLGASSSLLVALLHALAVTGGIELAPDELVRMAQDLETQTVKVPTGRQDYHAAVSGGVNACWFGPGPDRVERLLDQCDLTWLEEGLVLAFTGVSRASAVTNWRMFRAYMDGRASTRKAIARIGQIARTMREALLARDLQAVGILVNAEWRERRRLAPGVSTPEIDRMLRGALTAGALGAKLCGAGGGGCLVAVTPPERRRAVEAGLQAEGAAPLRFCLARRGLHVVPGGTLEPPSS